ncbi:flagellar basal body rod protein FlgB [Candidatus Riflebacteria bacterium]
MLRELTENFDFHWVKKSLDTAALRNKVIANNIANVNTPTYSRQFVTFEEHLKQVVEGDVDIVGKTNHSKHIPIDPVGLRWVGPRIHQEENTEMRNDENNVEIDREMADMAKNNLMYQFLLKRLNHKFTELNTVIQRGSRA